MAKNSIACTGIRRLLRWLACGCLCTLLAASCGGSDSGLDPGGARRFMFAAKAASAADPANPCPEPDYPVSCGQVCCLEGNTCSSGVCACADGHPVTCGEVCCLPDAPCDAFHENCNCPAGWTMCGASAYCCSPDEVCENFGCQPKE